MNDLNHWLQQALQQHQAGRLADAVVSYRQALALQPNHPQCHYNLALALHTLGQLDAAVASYQRAIALNPRLAEAHNNLGNIFLLQNRLEDARQAYSRALEITPRLLQAQFNLGLVLKRQNLPDLAVEHFQAALAIAPDYAEAFDNLCSLLKSLGRTEEWLEAFKKYERLGNKPDWFFVAGLYACRYLGDFQREQEYLRALYAYPFTNSDIGMLSGLLSIAQFFDIPQAQLLRLYQAYNQAAKRQYPVQAPLVSPYRSPRKKLRVGYLSADLRNHVMGKMLYQAISRHDTGQFEVYCYSLSSQQDNWTERFRACSHKFVRVDHLDTRRAAEHIAEDDLDILVDLSTHTQGGRPGILAYKPARVQITHIGSTMAVGLDSIDFKLTDQYADAPGNQDYLLERLLPMQGCVFPYRRIEPAAQHDYRRDKLGISPQATVLGAFVNPMKLGPRCLALWRRVLEALPAAVLAFSPSGSHAGAQASYLRLLSAAGIAADRAVFIPPGKNEADKQARYSIVDMVLDTLPCGGVNGTLEALDMGVPVVTLCGTRFGERTSYSILMNLGVAQTIAHSETEFVDIACRLAGDAAWRDSIVEQIRRGMNDSPLVDMDHYTRNLEDAYRRAIAVCPAGDAAANNASKTLFQEGVRHHQAKRLQEASRAYQQVLAQQPGHTAALYLHGMLHKQLGRSDEAIQYLQRAIASSPAYLDAHQALGNIFLEQGRTEAARACYEQVLRLKPGHFQALNGLGRALTQANQLPQAIATLRQATDSLPQQPEAHFNLGVAYQKQGNPDAAEEAYRRALALDPDNSEAHFNLGALHQIRGATEHAITSYRHVLRLQPGHASAYYHLGEVLFGAGRINAWLENFQQFQRQTPPSAMLAVYGLQACQYLGEVDQQQSWLEGLLNGAYPYADAADEHDRLEELLYLLLFLDVPQQRLFALYQRYNEISRQADLPLPAQPPRAPDGKIRVGYLSGDLRDHVMGKMMYQAISRHDASQFEVYCYSLSSRQDAWTERFRAASHQFTDLCNLSARDAALRIAKDSLDILVDLSTHTKGGMPEILLHKPARVQITHIASAGAVGLETIDFKLTDHYADTPENQQFLLERLLPMQGCVFPYRHIAPSRQHGYQREKLGIARQTVVLGAFVQLMKLTPRCLALWREVLETLPNAVLALSPLNDEASACYLRRLEVAGIPSSRVIFIPQGKDEADNQARYSVVDMVLDPLPFGGVNGTLEALDMCVPVVTLCGQRHGERTSYSILMNLGVPHTIARSTTEFVDIARRLALDADWRNTVVEQIRCGLKDSPLVDMDSHTRNLELAYRQALSATQSATHRNGREGAA